MLRMWTRALRRPPPRRSSSSPHPVSPPPCSPSSLPPPPPFTPQPSFEPIAYTPDVKFQLAVDAIEDNRGRFFEEVLDLSPGTTHLDRGEHEKLFKKQAAKWNELWGNAYEPFDRSMYIPAFHASVWAWLNRP